MDTITTGNVQNHEGLPSTAFTFYFSSYLKACKFASLYAHNDSLQNKLACGDGRGLQQVTHMQKIAASAMQYYNYGLIIYMHTAALQVPTTQLCCTAVHWPKHHHPRLVFFLILTSVYYYDELLIIVCTMAASHW